MVSVIYFCHTVLKVGIALRLEQDVISKRTQEVEDGHKDELYFTQLRP